MSFWEWVALINSFSCLIVVLFVCWFLYRIVMIGLSDKSEKTDTTAASVRRVVRKGEDE